MKYNTKIKKNMSKYTIEAVGFLLSFLVLVPYLMVIINSFKTKRQANLLTLNLDGVSWGQFIENYKTVIEDANIFLSFFNSAVVTFSSTVVVLLCASMAAFIVVRRKSKISRFLNNFMVIGLTLPLAMVPLYFLLNNMNLTNGTNAVVGAVLAYGASLFPFTFFIYTGYIKGISQEIDEAAIVDGANPLQMFFKVILPLLKPVTVTALMHCVMSVWNDFGISIYLLNTPKRKTAVLTTYMFMGQKASDWQLLFADVVLVSLPVIILYLIMQKHIFAGLTDGAVKG